jgi:hypothetical protein
VSSADVERLVERIESAVADADGELDAERIGGLCLEGLRELDVGAYLQFAGTLAEPTLAISGQPAPGGFRPARTRGSEVTPEGGTEERNR